MVELTIAFKINNTVNLEYPTIFFIHCVVYGSFLKTQLKHMQWFQQHFLLGCFKLFWIVNIFDPLFLIIRFLHGSLTYCIPSSLFVRLVWDFWIVNIFDPLFLYYNQVPTWKRNILRTITVLCEAGVAVAFRDYFAYFGALIGKKMYNLGFLNSWESLCNLIGSCPCLYHTI